MTVEEQKELEDLVGGSSMFTTRVLAWILLGKDLDEEMSRKLAALMTLVPKASKHIKELQKHHDKALISLDNLYHRTCKLKEVLRFYAHSMNHCRGDGRDRTEYLNPMQLDNGRKAREALGE